MEVKKQVIEVGNLKARIRELEARPLVCECGEKQMCKMGKRIFELEAQLDAAKAENAKLENRHVQFMVEGGPVVMATDYDKLKDKLKAENDRLRAALDKATGPVTDGEWTQWMNADLSPSEQEPSYERLCANFVIAARKEHEWITR